jgi:hypothetical protein
MRLHQTVLDSRQKLRKISAHYAIINWQVTYQIIALVSSFERLVKVKVPN